MASRVSRMEVGVTGSILLPLEDKSGGRMNEKVNFRSLTLAFGLSLLFLILPSSTVSQTKPEKRESATVIYEALSASNALLWLARDQGLDEKYRLDVHVVHGRGATPVQALVSGSVEFGAFGGPSTIAANLRGSDLVFVAAKPNYMVMSIWTRKDSPIKFLTDLRGKTIGVSLPGSSTHTIARLSLRKIALTDKEVKFVHHGTLPEIFVSLDKGLVDAGVASAPRPGFQELADLSAEKIPFLQGAIEVQRRFLQSRRQLVLNFLKAYVESIKVAKEKPELALASIVKNLKVKPEVAREAYRSFARVWEEVPYVRSDSVQAILDMHPKEVVKDIRPERFIDNSLIKELEQSGFIKELYKQ
jgi:NitT/TauT family transport system substrate-binding protein